MKFDGTTIRTLGEPESDNRVKTLTLLKIGNMIVSQIVSVSPVAFDIGVKTVAYTDPLLAEYFTPKQIGLWVIVRVTHVRPIEQAVLVEAVSQDEVRRHVGCVSEGAVAQHFMTLCGC